MYSATREKRGFDFFFWLIVAVLLASALYLQDIERWEAIKRSGFPLKSHILARLGFFWTVFWPAIVATAIYPMVKQKLWGAVLERQVLTAWKLFTLVTIAVLWWAMFYGS